VAFGYDENSNRTLLRDGEGTETYAYDALDRLSKLVRGARAFSYDYDAASNVTQRRYPDGRSVDYAYDNDGRLEQVISAAKTTVYSYDAASQLTETALPNGYEELRGYDRAGRPGPGREQEGRERAVALCLHPR
jgi:YD repeat-containing protein